MTEGVPRMSDDAPGGPVGNPSHDPWAAPGSVPDGTEGPQYAHVPLDKPAASDAGSASGGPAAATTAASGASARDGAEPAPQDARASTGPALAADHWPAPAPQDARASTGPALAADHWPAPAPAPDHDSGVTIAAGEVPAPQDLAPSSVHDQQTVTSLPGVTPTPAAGTPQGDASFASFPPPLPGTVSPGSVSGPSPFAPPADGAVPPPPISPDGPGQVPYGYPGGYGHPGPPGYGVTPSHGGGPGYGGVPSHGGTPGHYGWPGVQPAPSNGMGITAMVLGIVAAVGFCLWPIAIVVGVLALIFGLIGRSKANRGEATNPGQALAGIICGATGLALGMGLAVLIIVAP
ncbi:DUF4190 domain-containing protein [Streptomyces sp. NPDC048737]|uniref:DUF4190 domain-containing protein n=1 Tax=unclassified Streptomyces TaxID=2593676 RepID=UPI003432AE54